jgi:type III secretion protein V
MPTLSASRISPRADLALAVLVVSVIAMMVVPLPTVLIDLLIALNLTLGVLLLAGALYMRDALGFAAFPTLLLLSTLYRLALNVSSTRLILLQADAGRVIEAFGAFVVRGDYRVGALVFAMLTLIQFIVIARGAERVAEVSARFSLDALPGRQLAIDAELRSGSLRPETARALRRRLEQESQLFGALDGALKFVKGDAIAGIVITLVNFVGGVAIGVFARDLPLTQSLTTYGLLTIGDGLVTQIPALLGATAAGVVVTRVSPDAQEGSLAHDIARQLFREPRALMVGALVLFGLALVPELPLWPFALLASLCVLGALAARRADESRSAEFVERSLITLSLGRALHRALTKRGARALDAALQQERRALLAELGIDLPQVDVRLDTSLPPRAYAFAWRELPTTYRGEPTQHSVDDIARALASLARSRAADCLDLDAVQRMIDALEREQPALVRSSLPRPLTPTMLANVLRLLVLEGVSVRWLGEIVAAVAPYAARDESAEELVEHARRALAARISHALAPEKRLQTLRLSPDTEEALLDGLQKSATGTALVLSPDLAREIVRDIAAAHGHAPRPHVLITQAVLRRHVRTLLADAVPDLRVVSAHELTSELELAASEPIGP